MTKPMALHLFDPVSEDHQSKPEWQVQSQTHDQGAQLERHEEGDEEGGGAEGLQESP